MNQPSLSWISVHWENNRTDSTLSWGSPMAPSCTTMTWSNLAQTHFHRPFQIGDKPCTGEVLPAFLPESWDGDSDDRCHLKSYNPRTPKLEKVASMSITSLTGPQPDFWVQLPVIESLNLPAHVHLCSSCNPAAQFLSGMDVTEQLRGRPSSRLPLSFNFRCLLISYPHAVA